MACGIIWKTIHPRPQGGVFWFLFHKKWINSFSIDSAPDIRPRTISNVLTTRKLHAENAKRVSGKFYRSAET